MGEPITSEVNPGPTLKTDLNGLLSDLNSYLSHALESLRTQGLNPGATTQDEDKLPDPETVKLAARAVDLSHQIQLILDPPALILADHFLGGYMRTKCLLAAVQRGVPDALENGPIELDELVEKTSSRGDRLGQILRILCNAGIFRFDDATKLYSNSPASSLLRSGHWTQWHNWARLYGNQFYDIARGIPDSTHKDAVRWAAQINYDTDQDMFSFFRAQGWVPELHRTLGGGAAAQMPGILEDYPWHEVADELVMDIGGGSGAFLAGLLRRYSTMQGGIYDLPHVIDHVRPFFGPSGQYADVANQVQSESLVGGDFFTSIPPSAVYTMKWCLHDWKDTQAVEILTNIRASIVTGLKSRLIVLESILSNDHSGRLSQYGDINMMMTADGQERSEEQWRGLASASGWRIEKIWNLRGAWVKAMDFRTVTVEKQK